MDNRNYMILSDEAEFQSAVFNGDIKLSQTYSGSSTNGKFTYVKEDNFSNSKSDIEFNITFPKDKFMLLNDAFLLFDINTTTTTKDTSVETFLIPNIASLMTAALTISTTDFTYNVVNTSDGRAFSVFANINKMRSYTPNQVALVSELENMTFAATNSDNNGVELNSGFCVAKSFFSPLIETCTTKYYCNVSLNSLLPVLEKIKMISGIIQISMNFSFDKEYITSGKPINLVSNETNKPVLATVNELSVENIRLVYSTISTMNENFINNNSIERLSAITVKRLNLTPATANLTMTNGQYLTTVNSTGSVSSTGKPLQMIIVPRIKSCTRSGATTGTAPIKSAANPDKTISTLICADNFTGNNKNYILNGLLYINNVAVKSDASGTVYPMNRNIQQKDSSFSDSFNFMNAFVTVLGTNTSGRDSNSALTFNQYKNWFKALVIDLSNETDGSIQRNDCSFEVSFDISSINNIDLNGGQTDYVFDGDIFMISMTVV